MKKYNFLLLGHILDVSPYLSTKRIAEICLDIWGILKKVTVKSVLTQEQFFRTNHIVRCRSKLLQLGFSKLALVLVL